MNITPTPAVLPRDFYVYVHRRASTGEVFYVGKGQGRRAWVTGGRGSYWTRVARKSGVVVAIAADGIQEWYAHELERDLIALHGRIGYGLGPLVNMTDGGEGMAGWVPSQDTRRRISESNLRALANPSTRAKLSIRRRGVALPESTRSAMSIARRDMKASPEARAAISGAMKGKKKSDQHTASIRAAHAMRVTCIETGAEFDALIDAAQWISPSRPKTARSAICMCCKGERKSAYGYTWRYAE